MPNSDKRCYITATPCARIVTQHFLLLYYTVVTVATEEKASALGVLAGSRAAKETFDQATKRILADPSLRDPDSLRARSQTLESQARNLQTDLASLSTNDLDGVGQVVVKSRLHQLRAMEMQVRASLIP